MNISRDNVQRILVEGVCLKASGIEAIDRDEIRDENAWKDRTERCDLSDHN